LLGDKFMSIPSGTEFTAQLHAKSENWRLIFTHCARWKTGGNSRLSNARY
jgi:hypothetical protein